jgi:hypothetical protein
LCRSLQQYATQVLGVQNPSADLPKEGVALRV